ncbi:MAG: dihydrolipoyl dehydrogenase [Gammaproteobacteria bacterium]|nr:dihydrolipoyl dehydrogenase [Gammaproteobacteria bacterium]
MTRQSELHAEVLVIGGGPGGYTAAFRAADLGKQVVLVERFPVLGGVCLNVGCIPSKALLHSAQVIHESQEIAKAGIVFQPPKLEFDNIRDHKNKTVRTLTGGLEKLAKVRNVTVVTGEATFASDKTVAISGSDEVKTIRFDNAIIAAGSRPSSLPGIDMGNPRIMDSTDALKLEDIPKKLLIIGGGIIGLEMATVYHAFGSEITIVEYMDQLIPGCDADLVRPLHLMLKRQYKNIYLNTKVTEVKSLAKSVKVSFEGENAPDTESFDKVLVAVGRRPNGDRIDAGKAGLAVDERGFITVNDKQQTNVNNIYAIGDITGNPMLAHKATHEGKVAAEVIAGMPVAFEAKTIPSVAYTDPEIAWMGVTETEAKSQDMEYDAATFPWAASGRAIGINRKEGLTKLLFDKQSGRIIGAGIVGPNAGELIAETVLALEMGADAEDIGLSIHPHPTLSESVAFAAEMATGTITDLYHPKK